MQCYHVSSALLLYLVYSATGLQWDHNERRDSGPQGWSRRFPTCGGERQSPIDIDREFLRFSSSLTTFELPGYETIPRGAHWELVNTGHNLQIQLNGDYQMREGGLTGSFRAVYMDFRWGAAEQFGSEHSINGTLFPLELQIIHYNIKYGSYDEAVQQPDGLAAFAFQFRFLDSRIERVNYFDYGEKTEIKRAKDHDNPIYAQIINKLDRVAYQGQQATLRPVPLLSLLPINLNNYYRYEGSLTYPPCHENVVWTVFTDIIEISLRQLHLLRTSLMTDHPPSSANSNTAGTKMLTNRRPVQPLAGRIIYSSNIADATFWTAPLSPISITLAVLLGFILLFVILGRQPESYELEMEGVYRGQDQRNRLVDYDYDNDIDAHLD